MRFLVAAAAQRSWTAGANAKSTPDHGSWAHLLIGGGDDALSDIFEKTREEFLLPDGIIYLDGNSLGAMPKKALARLQEGASEEWGKMLIRGWNDANWIDLPDRTGNKIARLIGAEQGTVM